MRYWKKTSLQGLVITICCLPIAGFAGIMVSLDSITPYPPDTNYFEWSYSATISHGDGLYDDGNVFFTIYDLPEQPFTVTGTGDWNFYTSQVTGETPPGQMPVDDAAKWNVTFYLDCMGCANYPGSATPLIQGFNIVLTTDAAEFGQYSWQNYDQYPSVEPNSGRTAALQSGLGMIRNGGMPTVVPEPTPLALMGLGIVSFGFRRKTK